MLRYKRRKGDKLPTKKDEMLSVFFNWYTPNNPIYRESPTVSPVVYDAEQSEHDSDDERDEEGIVQVVQL